MRLKIHHRIGKIISNELKELGRLKNEKLFLLGNIFPDLIHSYIWCPHKYQYSREYIKRKLDKLKKKPRLFSFHLGILTHYICDYFCYPHSSVYDKGFIHHIIYEIRQKIPEKIYRTDLKIKSFSIEELDRFVIWYEGFRKSFEDNESDFLIAAWVASNFLQANAEVAN